LRDGNGLFGQAAQAERIAMGQAREDGRRMAEALYPDTPGAGMEAMAICLLTSA
jgi:hypothetical protein